MRPLPGCPSAEYHVEANGRVVIRTLLPNGVINEQRTFRDMKAAHKAISKNVYCGRRGSAFLASGKNRSSDMLWAQARLNGLVSRGNLARAVRGRRAADLSGLGCGCGGSR